MNRFIEDYLERLRRIESDDHVKDLYHWLWEKRREVRNTARLINKKLELAGENELQPDLPCQTIGSRKGLLFLLVNPGWDKVLNRKEETYCRVSKENYVDAMLNFFETHPKVVGQRIRFAAQMISFHGLLRDGVSRFGLHGHSEARWRAAQQTQLVGHWELFPFHSSGDGLTARMAEHGWLATCFLENARAAVRLKPELLVAMSKQGAELLKSNILAHEVWVEGTVGCPKAKLAYCKTSEGGEVLLIRRQWFSTPRVCMNAELFSEVDRLRASYRELVKTKK